jgi:hypothetical protein
VDEVPRPKRPFLPLDEQQILAGEDEEVLLVGLRVVQPAWLAGFDHRQGDAEAGEPLQLQIWTPTQNGPVGLEDASRSKRLVRQPGRVSDIHDEPALGQGCET